jgi:hypothetical protein
MPLHGESEWMSASDADLSETIARHEREIAELHAQVKVLQEGHAKEQLEAQIARRVAELEADLKLQELQEAMAQEQAPKKRHHRFLWIR